MTLKKFHRRDAKGTEGRRELFLVLIFVCAFFLSVPAMMKREFKLPPIHADIPFNPAWESTPSGEVQAILQQPFTYFTHGNQCYVFESADGKYVLKLFRYKRSPFALLQKIKGWIAKQRGRRPKLDLMTKANRTFQAAHIAYTEASECTQVVFCHLNITQSTLPCLQTKMGKIPLDQYRFCLQRKVVPFKTALLTVKDNPIELQKLIDSLKTLLIERSSKGIRNSDPNLLPNFGFLDGKAVEIDFGNYEKSTDPHEVSNFMQRLGEWLKQNAPEFQFKSMQQ